MTANYLNNLFRVRTAEYNVAGRWSDPDIYTLLTEAQNWMALKLKWPLFHAVAASPNGTQTGVQEYTLPDNFIQIDRCYIAGQACVPTDIETLEGDTIEYYDQSFPNTYTPQWSSNPVSAYPVTNTQMGYPQGVSPYYVGQRPSYYENGGNLGITPVPAGQYQIDLWGIGVPPVLANEVTCVYPQIAASSLVWRAIGDAMFSDADAERREKAYLLAEQGLVDVRTWRQDFMPKKNRGPRVLGYRNAYRRGTVLSSSGYGNYN
jgi:hypothetical protein